MGKLTAFRCHTPSQMSNLLQIIQGDCVEKLRELPEQSVQCCVTSPPYWGLRDYGCADQIGLEPTLEEWLRRVVNVFSEVHRVLRNDGTIWVNMGDCHAGGGNGGAGCFAIKAKDLMGQPWMLAFALRAAGWYLRRDIIWYKPNAMPESCTDRPTTANEYVFLLSKRARYYYDEEAIMEPVTGTANPRSAAAQGGYGVRGWDMSPNGAHKNAIEHAKPGGSYKGSIPGRKDGPGQDRRGKAPRQPKVKGHNEDYNNAICRGDLVEMRKKRSVWSIPAFAYKKAHFATFPPDLVKPCVLAGSRPGDVVLDPFGGSGTTGMVALELGRRAILIELNRDYCKLIEERTNVTPGLAL